MLVAFSFFKNYSYSQTISAHPYAKLIFSTACPRKGRTLYFLVFLIHYYIKCKDACDESLGTNYELFIVRQLSIKIRVG
jgi:hypothetical protein